MDRSKVKLIVEVELDEISGEFSNAESARDVVQYLLEHSIPHYKPKVTIQQD
jgi:hypothetical protein